LCFCFHAIPPHVINENQAAAKGRRLQII